MLGGVNFQIRKIILKNKLDLQKYVFRESCPVTTIPMIKIINKSNNLGLILKIQQCRERLTDYLKTCLDQQIILSFFSNAISTCIFLASQFGCFALTSNLIKLDVSKKLKIWIHQDFFINQRQIPLNNGTSGEKAMMKSILAIFKPFLKLYQKLTAGLQNIRDLQERILQISLQNQSKQAQNKQKQWYSQKMLRQLSNDFEINDQNCIQSTGEINNKYNSYKNIINKNQNYINNYKKPLRITLQNPSYNYKFQKKFLSSKNVSKNKIYCIEFKRKSHSKPFKDLRKTQNCKYNNHQNQLFSLPINIKSRNKTKKTKMIQQKMISKNYSKKQIYLHYQLQQTTVHSIRQNSSLQNSKISLNNYHENQNILNQNINLQMKIKDILDNPDSKVSSKTKTTNISLQDQVNNLFNEDQQEYDQKLYKEIQMEFIRLL